MKPSSVGVESLRAVVIDDSALYRRVLSDALASLPNLEVVGTARDGQQGLYKIEQLQPDIITVDLEMPLLDGIGLLHEISSRQLDVLAIVVSALSAHAAKATTAALDVGAFDFVVKPQGRSMEQSVQQLEHDLRPKLAACFAARRQRRKQPPPTSFFRNRMRTATDSHVKEINKPLACQPHVVAIGASTGGPLALGSLLPQIPGDFPLPILVVQHMPPMFTKCLADDLDRHAPLRVQEASHGDCIEPGNIYLAPGGSQMRITRSGEAAVVQVTDDPPERNCKPAVDYLFRSVSEVYGGHALGVILTGMGDDGTRGAIELKRRGASILAQHEHGCTVYGMPRQVIEEGLADVTTPLNHIASQLCVAAGRGGCV